MKKQKKNKKDRNKDQQKVYISDNTYDDDQENDEETDELRQYSKKRVQRQQRKRRRRKKVITLVILALIAGAVALNWDYLEPAHLAKTISSFFNSFGQSKYPVEFTDGSFKAAVPIGSNVGVLTDTSFIIYSKNGDKLDTRPHGINNPNAANGSNKALIYDRGGKSFRVETRYAEEFTSTAEYNITSASMAENGNFAIVTEADNFLSEVKVYDNSCNVIFKWDSIKGRILTTALSPDGKTLAAVLLGVQNGNICSDVYFYNVSNKDPIATTKYDNCLLYSLSFKGGNKVAAVGENKTVFIGTDGKELLSYDYGDKELSGSTCNGGPVVLAFKKGTTQTELVSFDKNGKRLGSALINAADVENMSNKDGKTILISHDKLFYFNDDCSKTAVTTVQSDIKSAYTAGGQAYIFRSQSVSVSDLSAKSK